MPKIGKFRNLLVLARARSCSLVLGLCLLVLSLCSLVLSSCSDLQIQFLEGVISLYKFIAKSVISGSKWPKSENFEIWGS